MSSILRLYPEFVPELRLKELYLRHDVRQIAADTQKPFVYSNFIQSLDGRIAIFNARNEARGVPVDVANGRDWRLYQELAAQADTIIVSGPLMQKMADGFAPDMLMMNNPRYAYLREWREENRLASLPNLAVVSRALNFTLLPQLFTDRTIHVMTVDGADRGRINALRDQGAQVHVVDDGHGSVDGKVMIDVLAEAGQQTIYSGAGPTVLHMLARSGVLNRQYVTIASRLVAGEAYATLNEGVEIVPAVRLRLHELHLDTKALKGDGQLFASYDVFAREAS